MKKILNLSALLLLNMALISCQSPTNGTSPIPSDSNATSSPTTASPNPIVSESPDTNPAGSDIKFSYVGMDSDKVSPGNNVVPDKVNDLHFTGSYTFPNDSEITLISISRFENGKPNQVAGWSIGSAIYWVLAVEANGKAFNTTKIQKFDKLSGNVKFDFYGSDLASLMLTKPGTTYQLQIAYKDASGIAKTITQDTTL